LDEIGELSPDLQVKFLRVLQEWEIEPVGSQKRKINVRVIAATNRRLGEEMAGGRFRVDLSTTG
jgi:two-component system response regulator HydG